MKKKRSRKGVYPLKQECLDAIDSAMAYKLMVRGRTRALFTAWREVVEEDDGTIILQLAKKLNEA